MEVISVNERFDDKFLHTRIIFEHNGQYFSAQSPKRETEARVEALQPDNKIPRRRIPHQDIFPLASSQEPDKEIRATDIDDTIFIKQNRLTAWERDGDDTLAKRVLHELSICMIMDKAPNRHPNIGRFRGYHTREGRITGICYEKYAETLEQRLERGYKVDADACCYILGKALHFLHEELGLVHNDLGPSNIMFASLDSTEPILIDFDSCMPVGGQLPRRGSHQWPSGTISSVPANDNVVLEKLREHILDEGHGQRWVQW